MKSKPCILFLCTGNACRSQMAEGFLRQIAGDRFDVYSAGIKPEEEIHPLAIEVMDELGVDLSGQEPKDVRVLIGRLAVRYLIITCNEANEECPRIFPGMPRRWFWPFDDPARRRGSPDELLDTFRSVRDQIRDCIVNWLSELETA